MAQFISNTSKKPLVPLSFGMSSGMANSTAMTRQKTPINVQGAINSSVGNSNKPNSSLMPLPPKPAGAQQQMTGTSGGNSFSGAPSAGGSNNNEMGSLLGDIKNRLQSFQTQDRAKTDKPVTQATPKPSLFTDIVSSLQKKSEPSNEQDEYLKELAEAARGNQAIGDRAAGISDMYGDEIKRVGNLGAGAVAGNLSGGTNVVGAGNAAIASQSVSQRMSSLSAAQQAALQGTQQQLSAQGQTQEGLSQALAGANTQQAQGITGLGAAGGLAQPTQVSPGNTLFSPTDGSPVAGGLGGYVDYRTAEQVMGLISQYPDAGYRYNENLSPEQNLQLAQGAIQASPTYQKSTFGVPGQGTIAGAQGVQTAQQGYNSSYQTYNETSAQKEYADDMVTQLQEVMETFGINPTDSRKANEVINRLRQQFGYEGQSAFETALSEAQRAYSTLLTIGGGTIPTEATAASNTILNPDATVGQIMQAIQQLKAAGESRLAAQGNQVNTYWQQLNAAGGQGGNNQGGGSQDGGEWNW